jgi:hypothetical protein
LCACWPRQLNLLPASPTSRRFLPVAFTDCGTGLPLALVGAAACSVTTGKSNSQNCCATKGGLGAAMMMGHWNAWCTTNKMIAHCRFPVLNQDIPNPPIPHAPLVGRFNERSSPIHRTHTTHRHLGRSTNRSLGEMRPSASLRLRWCAMQSGGRCSAIRGAGQDGNHRKKD